MLFSKAHISYSNTMYILYIWLRVRDTVSNVWCGIKSVLEKIPVEHRYKLLKDVK